MAMTADEYGDVGRVSGTQYATMDTVLPDKDLHISNTRKGPRGLTFYLFGPCPVGMTAEEWESITAERWDKAFA